MKTVLVTEERSTSDFALSGLATPSISQRAASAEAPRSPSDGGEADLTELRARAENMRADQRRIARLALANPEAVAHLSASELARRLMVSTATIVRLSQRLGFSGYPHMSRAFRRLYGLDQTVLESFALAEESLLGKELEMLNMTISPEFTSQIERVVAALLESEGVVLSSAGVHASAAAQLSAYLMRFSTARVVNAHSLYETVTAIHRFADVRAALITLSFGGYARHIRAQEAARREGLGVIAISDSSYSPAALAADTALVVRGRMIGGVFTMAPLAAAIDEIAHRLALARGHDTRRYLENVNRLPEDSYIG